MSNKETFAFEIGDVKKYNRYSKGRLLSFIMIGAGLLGSVLFTHLRDGMYENIELYDDEYDEEVHQNEGL